MFEIHVIFAQIHHHLLVVVVVVVVVVIVIVVIVRGHEEVTNSLHIFCDVGGVS